MHEALALSSTLPDTYRKINLAWGQNADYWKKGNAHTRQKSYRKYIHAVCRAPHAKIFLVLIEIRGWSQN